MAVPFAITSDLSIYWNKNCRSSSNGYERQFIIPITIICHIISINQNKYIHGFHLARTKQKKTRRRKKNVIDKRRNPPYIYQIELKHKKILHSHHRCQIEHTHAHKRTQNKKISCNSKKKVRRQKNNSTRTLWNRITTATTTTKCPSGEST